MRSAIITLLAFVFTFVTATVFAQSFEVPKDYKLIVKEDYAPYNNKVVECINWLENTPITSAPITRKEASDFLLAWINGSPINIGLDPFLMSCCDGNPELLLAYMGGCTRYVIEHPVDPDVAKYNIEGIRSLFKVYYANADVLKKNKDLKKLLAANERGELGKFLLKQSKS